jgi:hypothetical protein
MLRCLLLLSLVLSPFLLFSQSDSLKFGVIRPDDPRSAKIDKARRVMLDRFLEGDMRKMKEVRDYLADELTNNHYLGLIPGEYRLSLYWTQEYNKLLRDILSYDSVKTSPRDARVHPHDPDLYYWLLKESERSRLMLEFYVRMSGEKAVDKDLLVLNLRWLLLLNNPKEMDRDSVNKLANEFLGSHPGSPYEYFVRYQVRNVYQLGNWGIAVEFFSGYAFLTDQLHKYFLNSIPVGVAFDISYKKIILFIRDYIGFSYVNKMVPYTGGAWEKGAQVRIYVPEASLGYAVLDKYPFRLIPFVGIAATEFSPTSHDTDQNPDLKYARLDMTTTWVAGACLDFKLVNWNRRSNPFHPQNQYAFVRLRYSLNLPQFGWRFGYYNGVIHSITVGVGLFQCKIKRVY